MNKEVGMKRDLRVLAAAGVLGASLTLMDTVFAQKTGGILKTSHFDSPASMSLLEESTAAALRPVMGVFNNLVLYDQHITVCGRSSPNWPPAGRQTKRASS